MIAWMLALVLLMTVSVLPAAATETDAVWHSTSTAGNEVLVTLNANTAVVAGQLQLNYDAGKLTFVAVEAEDAYVGYISVNAQMTGVVKISFVGTGAADGSAHSLLKVRFTGTDANAVTVKGQLHTPAGEKMTIGVWDPQVKMGDVNGDDDITVLDAMCVAQYIVGDIGADKLNVDAANVNGDGDITVLDAMLIAQFIVGDIDHFPVADSQNNTNQDGDHDAIVLDKPDSNNDLMQSIGQNGGNSDMGILGAGNNVYGDVDNDLTDKNPGNGEGASNAPAADVPSDTGDDFPIGRIVIIMVLCAAGVVVLVILGKRKENDK
jgi:hypothetical protein